MCGISALTSTSREGRVNVDDLRRMSSAIAHRGPDGAGFALVDGGRTGLAHVRLSLVDLAAGQQPLFDDDESVGITFNGELYDYAKTRDDLKDLGHTFRTSSDTEVLLKLYKEYGLGFLERINGEFAFILWDRRKAQLIAVRDPFGIKPLFYAQCGPYLALCSEIKGILELPNFPRQIATEYLTGPFFGVVHPEVTAFAGVRAVRPGHYLRIDQHGTQNEVAYDRPRFNTDHTMNLADAKAGVQAHLRRAVARRMVADVPVHVYLSGGIDSTLMAALIAERGGKPAAYNVSFEGSPQDERPAAAETAAYYGFPFKTVRCSMATLADNLQRAVYHTEAPIFNLNCVAKMMLSARARTDGVKACITGEGADEALAGYAFFKLEALWRMRLAGGQEARDAREIGRQFERAESKNEGLMWDKSMDFRKSAAALGFPSFYQMSADRAGAAARWVLARNLRIPKGWSPGSAFRQAVAGRGFETMDPVNATRRLSLDTLSGYIIPNLGDRVEMANSLEGRTPFLDREFFAFASTIPPRHLIDVRNLREKVVLREAFDAVLPPHVRAGKKQAFLAPSFRGFIATEEGHALFSDLLSRQAVRDAGLLRPSAIAALKTLWTALPAASAQVKRLDLVMGATLTLQLLHRLFISRRAGQSSTWEAFAMADRTPRGGLAG